MATTIHANAMLYARTFLTTSLGRPLPSGTVMRMRLLVILSTRATEEMSDFLAEFTFCHWVSSASAIVDTPDAGLHAEARAASHASAGCYGEPEHVGVLAVVVAEDELVQVERQVFPAD